MLKDFPTKLIIVYFLLLISFPLSLFDILKYDFTTAYLAVISFLFLLPAVFFLSKSYWKNKITIIVWCLRLLSIINFLLVSYRLGITREDIVAFVGTLSLTFFYELGYFIVTSGYFERFLRYWIWIYTAICIYWLLILLPIFFKYGLAEIIYRCKIFITYPLSWHWPNAFGLYLVLLFWMVIYFSQQNKKYLLALIFILPVLFFTYAKAAFLAWAISMGVAVWQQRKKKILTSIVLVLILLAPFIYAVFGMKSMPSGSSIQHSVEMRKYRWEIAFSQWKKCPLLGYGFRSYTTITPQYYYEGERRSLPVGSSHNDYVDLLLRGGIIYSILFWTFVLTIIWRGFRVKNEQKNLPRYLSYSIIALLVAALFQNPFKEPVTLALFWSYVAAIAYYRNKLKEKEIRDIYYG